MKYANDFVKLTINCEIKIIYFSLLAAQQNQNKILVTPHDAAVAVIR